MRSRGGDVERLQAPAAGLPEVQKENGGEMMDSMAILAMLAGIYVAVMMWMYIYKNYL